MDTVGLRFKEEVEDHILYWELVNECDEKGDELIELWFSLDEYGLKMYCFGTSVDNDICSEMFADYIESYKDQMIKSYMKVIDILEG